MRISARTVARIVGALVLLVIVAAGALAWYISMWRQEADPDFDASVASATFETDGPVVLFDEAHLNSHGLQTTYAPYAALLRNDGYRLRSNREAFRGDVLNGVDVLVIVNARGSNVAGRRDEPAFSAEEIDAVVAWVESGRSLLLVADHAPFGAAAAQLAERFGVTMSNADTVDAEHHDPATGSPGFLLFSRDNGLLRPHAVIEGRSPNERVDRVLTFNGQSLEGPTESTVILALSDTAVDILQDGTEQRPATGSAQALVLEPGAGRVAVLGEAAMLTAQVMHPPFRARIVAGMNRSEVDNKQFTLNLMHWLSRVIG